MDAVLIKNGTLVTMDPQRRVLEKGHILIKKDRITSVGCGPVSADRVTECVDATGKIVIPGLINTHVHCSQQLARGLGDDLPILNWLQERIWPYEAALTEEDTYISALLCCVEQLHSGVTTFAEAGGRHPGSIGRAIKDVGMRALLSQSVMDGGAGLPPAMSTSVDEALAQQAKLFDTWHDSQDGRIRVGYTLRTIFNCSDELIMRTKEQADLRGTLISMHVGHIPDELRYARDVEGITTVQHLADLGVLDSRFLLVHSVWTSTQDWQLIAEHGGRVSHNPAAAMRTLGYADVPAMINAGIVVALGTDGAPANNRMCMLDEMWLTSLIHKGHYRDPRVMPAEKVLEMATVDGSQALQWGDCVGSLEVGKKADIVILDPRSPNMIPIHDVIANLVTSVKSENVESVLIDGEWALRDGRVLGVEEAALYENAQSRAEAIRKRAEVKLSKRFQVKGH